MADTEHAATYAADKDLDDAVNKTCRVTAACRSVEMLHHPQPLIDDPLALKLAGPSYLEFMTRVWQESNARSSCDPSSPGHQYFAARARLLDDRVLAALHTLMAASYGASAAGSRGSGGAGVSVQVVSLGAGLDTRPWRLHFPPGVAWFDVDQPAVVSLKLRLLAEVGAQLPPEAGLGGSQDRPEHQLRCSYATVACDLTQCDWMARLQAAGFDSRLPTVWVAEGLLYFLSDRDGVQLARATAAASMPAAAALLATHVPRVNLEANRVTPKDHALSRLFQSCADDLAERSAQELGGWRLQERSPDLGEVVAREYGGARCAYPYNPLYTRDFNGGQPLESVECLLTFAL